MEKTKEINIPKLMRKISLKKKFSWVVRERERKKGFFKYHIPGIV